MAAKTSGLAARDFLTFPVIATFVFCCLITAIIAYFFDREEQAKARQKFETEVAVRVSAIEAAIKQEFIHAGALRSYYATGNDMAQEQFDAFMKDQTELVPAMVQATLILRLSGSDLNKIELLRNNGIVTSLTRLQPFSLNEKGEQVPARPADTHYPVVYRWNRSKDLRPPGFDFATVPAVKTALEAVEKSGQPFVNYIYKRDVVDDKRPVFSLISPAVRRFASPSGFDIAAYLKSDYQAEPFIRAALQNFPWMPIDFYIETAPFGARSNASIPVFFIPADASRPSTPIGKEAWKHHASHSMVLNLQGVRWQVTGLIPSAKITREHDFALMVGIAGLLVTVISTTLVAILVASRRLVTEQVAARTAELVQARDEADAANRTKARFLSTMGHELRTPLNGVMGMAELLRDEVTSAKGRDYLDMVRQSGLALDEQINNVLTYSLVTAGGGLISRTADRLDHVLEEICERFRPSIEAKGLDFRVDIDETARIPVIFDVSKCRLVFTNLLSNAVKFTSSGSIMVSLTSVPDGPKHRQVTVTVSDTGSGMSEATRGNLFAAFRPGDDSISRRYQGAGLGLATIRELIAISDGQLDILSEEGNGTTVTVTNRFEVAG